jgi:outer membrane receptor protein involved in Fe transport
MDSKVVLDISLRASEYERESEKLAVNVKNKSGNTFSNIIGLTLAPTPYTSFFGKLSNVNRAPEVRELYFGGGAPSSCHWPRKICSNQPNDQLSEETLYGREVGVLLKNNHRRVKLHTKVSYFYDNISDYIETMPRMYRIVDGVKVDAGPTTATHRDYSTQNLNKVNRQGIEAEIGASINEFEANAKYSAMNMDCEACPSMYDAKTVSEPIHTSPADKFTLTMAYDYDKKNLKFEYKGVFVNQQKRMSERYKRAGYESPGYSTHGVQVNWSPNFKSIGKVELDLAIDNLTDKKYKVHNSGSGEFELGRNAKIGLTKYF